MGPRAFARTITRTTTVLSFSITMDTILRRSATPRLEDGYIRDNRTRMPCGHIGMVHAALPISEFLE
jgi:hypothetical protein